jgi:hypothetical protein
MYSNENMIMKYFPRRSITTSDIGECLCSHDLEWDKSDLNCHLSESDVLSSYDINQMTEIFQHRFLEFDMSSSHIGESHQSTISDIFPLISNENPINKRLFYRSLSDLNFEKPRRKYFLLTKHLSLMNIKPIQRRFSRENYPQSMELEPEEQSFNPITKEILSRLSMIRLFLTKLTDKFRSFIFDTFQLTKTPLITEEIIETYDIIEG